ncbi:class I mannose-6-phosphate isomerase [Sphingomonas jaspsi]|uniref:class I mannose-6-phosphate isomerase n=1 Tax=Sphingomonas jaspsi TaxID=392409 RepID=UPI0004B3B56A|nr:class I mannose-6-phosphate isomerase [Sphingomonas jaspsi]
MQKLPTRIVDKPWGRTGIDPKYGVDPRRKIGELWFEAPPGRPLDVMAKYLFTSERLSIQVHPDDNTARAHGHRCGKEEAWLILHAEPDAELGIGTVRPVPTDELLAAANDGTIVDLIDWRRPRTGDFIVNPARTVHALGAGLTVLEVQQAIDLTCRIYDYGRPRDLHHEEAGDACDAKPHIHPLDGPLGDASRVLIDGDHFGVAWCVGAAPPIPSHARDIQLLPIDAPIGDLAEGECALVSAEEAAALSSSGRFVLAWSVPA